MFGFLDSGAEEPRSKLLRYAISGVVFALLVAFAIWWYVLRFRAEKQIVSQFFSTLAAGDTQRAYNIWKPSASYAYKDFLDDWGAGGYYGPVKTFRLENADHPKGSESSVDVVVDISPDRPFPSDDDAAAQNRIKVVHIWVDSRDQSLSFPP